MRTTTICANCRSKNVCKYASEEYEVTVASDNPYLKVYCSQYIAKQVGSGIKPVEMKEIVKEWRKQHPYGRKIDCERETGLSRPTVIKWWEYEDESEVAE